MLPGRSQGSYLQRSISAMMGTAIGCDAHLRQRQCNTSSSSVGWNLKPGGNSSSDAILLRYISLPSYTTPRLTPTMVAALETYYIRESPLFIADARDTWHHQPLVSRIHMGDNGASFLLFTLFKSFITLPILDPLSSFYFSPYVLRAYPVEQSVGKERKKKKSVSFFVFNCTSYYYYLCN